MISVRNKVKLILGCTVILLCAGVAVNETRAMSTLGTNSETYVPANAVPEVLLNGLSYTRKERLSSETVFECSYKSLVDGRVILIRIQLRDYPKPAIDMHTDKRIIMWMLGPQAIHFAPFPSRHPLGLYQATNIGNGVRKAPSDAAQAVQREALVLGAREDITLVAHGPLVEFHNGNSNILVPSDIDDPGWASFLESLVREALAKAASRRLEIVGDLGRTDQGWTYVKLETAARFAGFAVKIEERGLKATLTKGGETRVIWAGEPMVKGEKGDVVMLKDGALWVPEFWESAGTNGGTQ